MLLELLCKTAEETVNSVCIHSDILTLNTLQINLKNLRHEFTRRDRKVKIHHVRPIGKFFMLLWQHCRRP